jgi:predicted small secreted protein
MKSVLALLIAGLAMLTLTACNTIQGVGRDIERAGQELEEAID